MKKVRVYSLLCSLLLFDAFINYFIIKGYYRNHSREIGSEIPFKEEFQNISNDAAMLVYSAYYWKDHIRLIGISKPRKPTLYCILRYSGTNTTTLYVKAIVVLLPGGHNRKYNAVYIICELNKHRPPATISISKYNYGLYKNETSLSVKAIPTEKAKKNFTLCLSPLQNNFRDRKLLQEWFEMNIILGVQIFNVYVNSCTDEVMQLLRMYQSKGYVTLINWPLPEHLCKLSENLHYCGQIAAVNDCLYRTKGYSKYIAVIDIDEFIIPQKEEDITWYDLLRRLPPNSVYVFRNAFFFRNISLEKKQRTFVSQSNTLRQRNIHKAGNRSKYIADVESVETLNIHNVEKMKGLKHFVDPSIGLLHHYRWTNVHATNTVQHNVTRKYFDILCGRTFLHLNRSVS